IRVERGRSAGRQVDGGQAVPLHTSRRAEAAARVDRRTVDLNRRYARSAAAAVERGGERVCCSARQIERGEVLARLGGGIRVDGRETAAGVEEAARLGERLHNSVDVWIPR